jgi:hypothetical protein
VCVDLAELKREMDFIRGFELGAQLLYWHVRLAMDATTFKSGVDSDLSWAGFTLLLKVDPVAGARKKPQFSRGQVRRFGWALQRGGMLKLLSKRTDARLIFLCSWAQQNSSVQKQADKVKASRPTRSNAPVSEGNGLKNGSRPTRSNGLGRHISIDIYLRVFNPSKSSRDDSTFQVKQPENQRQPLGELTPADQRAICKKFQRAGLELERARLVVNQLVGCMDAWKSTVKRIRNPIAYVDRLIEDAKDTDWRPLYANRGAAALLKLQPIPAVSSAPERSNSSTAGVKRRQAFQDIGRILHPKVNGS